MVMTQQEFVVYLTPELTSYFLDCIYGGLADYDNSAHYSAYARHAHTPRVVADIRNSHIVDRAQRDLVAMPNIRVRIERGRVLFTIADKLIVSFKKLDKHLRSRNIPTRQALAYVGQKPLFLDMPPTVTHLVVGYRATNPAETEFEVYAVCPDAESNRWAVKLSEEQMQLFPPDVLAPTPPAPSSARVSVKKQAKRKRQEEVSKEGDTDESAG